MKYCFLPVLLSITTFSLAQINMQDSTAQAIAYFSKGDKQSYVMSLQRVKLNGTDTTSNERITYEVDITVLDSTENAYLIEWLYHDYATNSDNELVKKIMSVAEDLRVVIETDALGAVKGVMNWQEVRDAMKKSLGAVRADFKKVPQMESVFRQVEAMYTTKEAIESTAIQDVQQFHTFHGGRYQLGEILEFDMKSANMYAPEKPFDTHVSLYLDELNPNDNNFILRSTQEIDSEQLTATTYEYLKSLAGKMGTAPPRREEVGKLTNVISTASRIHGTGWVIYSVQTKTVESAGVSNIEERIMEIK